MIMGDSSIVEKFNLSGRTAIITGGAGLLGSQHAKALIKAGANCVLVDINEKKVQQAADELSEKCQRKVKAISADITCKVEVEALLRSVIQEFNSVEILINNAAINPKVQQGGLKEFSRFEHFPLEQWNKELEVGLTGAFLCCQVIGTEMARQRKGVILNIASDLSIIAPDQRIYRQPGREEDNQPVKPVTYSVLKTGLIGLTKYLSTYWAPQNIRVNALSPGGVFDDQPDEFLHRLTNLIPLGRMANRDEYQAAVLFLVSDASSYMTGANMVIDGGRTAW